ncbi:MAG: type II secretion system protein [Gemmataceae bacterium]
MNITKSRPPARAGFTLIELLIVLVIIAILVTISVPAVLRALKVVGDVRTKAEIAQMADAMAAFRAHFGNPPFPPSQVSLSPNNPYCRRVWPRAQNLPGTSLSGGQVLVLFLGGMQSGSSGSGRCLGFSNNPTAPLSGSPNIPPFYEFRPDRLVGSAGQFQYRDGHGGQPYLYFGVGLGDGYNVGAINGVSPYRSPAGAFFNERSFQIISAGENGQFGPGGVYNPSAPNVGAAGRDDLSNFHEARLGVPGN